MDPVRAPVPYGSHLRWGRKHQKQTSVVGSGHPRGHIAHIPLWATVASWARGGSTCAGGAKQEPTRGI